MLVMHVRGEETPSPYSKSLESSVSRRLLQRAHGPFNAWWSQPFLGVQEALGSGVVWSAPKPSFFIWVAPLL
jgi:hypothetical protein